MYTVQRSQCIEYNAYTILNFESLYALYHLNKPLSLSHIQLAIAARHNLAIFCHKISLLQEKNKSLKHFEKEDP